MIVLRLIVGASLPIFLVACDSRTPTSEGRQIDKAASGVAASKIYSAAGKVTLIEAGKITIAHGPVEGLGWPAMTMTFDVVTPAAITNVKVGDQISFKFRKDGSSYALSSTSKGG